MRALFLLAAMLFISALFGQVAYVQPVRATAVATFDYGAVSEIPRDECKALVALYTSSNGVNWRNQALRSSRCRRMQCGQPSFTCR